MRSSNVGKLTSVREHTSDPQTDRIQSALKRIATFLRPLVFLDGRLLDGGNNDGRGPGLVISNTATTVNHGLGRELRGAFPVSMSGAGDVPFFSTIQPQDVTKQANLEAANPVTVKIWVW